jgi:dTDP-4-amino-4,6-dideoxygalactose transaminase
VDIHPKTFCIDPTLIEAAITPDTTAILATHVYGIPCDVEAIDAIAKKHGLKVIYDAAHAFDVEYKGRSILAYGDASTLSFHATKLFHTVEGGAVVLHDAVTDQQLRYLRSFGHVFDEHFALGINAKMSELHAAMGMAVLPHMAAILADRAATTERYDQGLKDAPVLRPTIPEGTRYNQSYYPLLFASTAARIAAQEALVAENIHPRRYFYPSLDTLPYVTAEACPVSRSAADRMLCLPLYHGLEARDVDRIVAILQRTLVGVPSQ